MLARRASVLAWHEGRTYDPFSQRSMEGEQFFAALFNRFLTVARECVSRVETTPLCGLGLVDIENDAVQERPLFRIRWGAAQTGCLRLIGEATPATVRPTLDLSNDVIQRELT